MIGFEGISVEDSQHFHQARHTVGSSAGKSRNLNQALQVECQRQKSQPIPVYGPHEDPRGCQENAIPADQVPEPQRRPSMLSCQDARAWEPGRSAQEFRGAPQAPGP